MPQTLYLDDEDFPVKPTLVYSTEKLVRAYAGNCMRIRNFADSLNHEVPFQTNGSINLATDVTPYVGAGPNDAATVTILYDQSGNGRNAQKSTFRAPKIKDKLMGTHSDAKPVIIFEGGSQQGKVFGLDFVPTGLNLDGSNYTVFAVMRPAHAFPKSQQATSDIFEGTIWSIEAIQPIGLAGTTTIGSNLLTVNDASNIFVNYIISGMGFNPSLVVGKTGNTLSLAFGGNAIFTTTNESYKACAPLATGYMSGDTLTPWGASVHGIDAGGYSVKDQISTYLKGTNMPPECGPTVVTWMQGNGVGGGPNGIEIYKNERCVAKNDSSNSRGGLKATYGFIGAFGGSYDIGGGTDHELQATKTNRAGEFWLAALVIYNQKLSPEQAAFVRTALYDRFNIKPARSKPTTTGIWAIGSSIGAGYVCLGLDSMFNVVADAYHPTAKMYNYCIAGGQFYRPAEVDVSLNYAFGNGVYFGAIKPQLIRARGKKIFIFENPGNDILSNKIYMADNITPFTFVSFAAGGTITTTANHGLVVGHRVEFTSFSGGTGVTINTPYWVKTTPSNTTFTISATPGGATITFTGTPVATMQHYTKTAQDIFDQAMIIRNDIAASAPDTKVFLMEMPPFVSAFVRDERTNYNTLINANAVANNYTVIAVGGLFPNHDNPPGNIDSVNFADGAHMTRQGHITTGNAIVAAIASAV